MGIRDLTAVRASDTLAAFDAQMRIDPPPEPGVRYERHAGIVRARGADNWITWWDVDAAQTSAAVGAVAAEFRRLAVPLEWKVYAHDRPANLEEALRAHGFVPDERETLMVLDLATAVIAAPADHSPEVTIARVSDAAGLAALIRVTSDGFGYDASAFATSLPPRIFGSQPTAAAYVAWLGGEPVGVGRLELPPRRSFASIWGGSTIAAHRKRGIFRALVATRARHARNAGYRYLTVDARDTSRPILARLGFVELTTIVGWNLTAAPQHMQTS